MFVKQKRKCYGVKIQKNFASKQALSCMRALALAENLTLAGRCRRVRVDSTRR